MVEPRNRNETSLDSAIQALEQMSPQSREVIVLLIKQLSEKEGVTTEPTPTSRLLTPADSMPMWVAKLKSERRSGRTIQMYQYLAERFLKRYPNPTRLDIQQYLAERLEETSPAAAENERKALASLFGFLYHEGLRLDNPVAGLKHIRVPYGERSCPSTEDIQKVLEVGCLRARDTDKLRTIITLLASTGLRLTEMASLRKEDINLDALEVRVTGKGDKRLGTIRKEKGG